MKHSSTHETRRRLGPGCSDTDILIELIGRWFRSPQGQSVWAAEKAITEQLIARLFGYHILQIGDGLKILTIVYGIKTPYFLDNSS